MAGKVKGTAVRITEKDARGYGYVGGGKGMRPNGGVTAIAAINGRGAYARNLKAREVTGGKKPGLARKAAGGALRGLWNQATREPLVTKISPAFRLQRSVQNKIKSKLAHRNDPMLHTNPRRHHKAPTAAQLAARKAFAAKARAGVFKRGKMKRNATASAWAKPATHRLGSIRKAKGGFRRNAARVIPGSRRRTLGMSLPRYALPHEGIDLNARTLVMPRRSLKKRSAKKTLARKTRKKATVARATTRQEKIMATKRRTKKKSAAAKVSTAKRRIRRKKSATKRPTHRKARRTAAQKVASKRNIRKAQASVRKHSKRKASKRVVRKTRRTKKHASKRVVKRTHTVKRSRKAAGGRSARKVHRKARRTAAQKAASKRNIKKAQASVRRGGKRRVTRRTKKHASKRVVHRKGKKHASKFRKNGRHHFKHGTMRRNDTMGAFETAFKVGAIAGIGFVAHKVGTALLNGLVVDKIVNAGVQAAAASPVTAPAAAGLGAMTPMLTGLLGGGAVLAVGILAANKFIDSADTKRLVTAGMFASYVQTLLVSLLERVAPQAAPMLAGGEASRMSAMYGVDPSSIMPRYAPISGMGEYFAQNGLGEYFAQNGLGEYFAQNGLGNYEGNPNIMQAAAGYGALESGGSNFLDPSSDLERELSIAEAAAGIGNIEYASAGMGNVFQAAAGFGDIQTVPGVDTNIPSGQLWAGTRSVGTDGNSENPAGILSTSGGDGIFG